MFITINADAIIASPLILIRFSSSDVVHFCLYSLIYHLI